MWLKKEAGFGRFGDVSVLSVRAKKCLHLVVVADPEHPDSRVAILEQDPETESDPALKEMRPQFADAQLRVRWRMSERFGQAQKFRPAGGILELLELA